MKKILLILLAIFALDAGARDLDKSFTGSWYNPDQSGHGFSVEVLPDGRALIYWYVYNPDGTPTFLLAIGNINGNTVHADVYHHTGMPFGSFDPSNLVQTHWGTLDFTVNDCNSATLSYNSTMSMGGEEFGSDTIQLTRLSSVAGLKCTTTPMHGNMHATVFDIDGEVAVGYALIFANGDLLIFGGDDSGAAVAVGVWQETTAGRFSFNATVFDWEGGALNISGTGSYFEDGIDASYTGGGQMFATRLATFHRGLSYSDLAGTYDIIDPVLGDVGNMTVTSTGSISGGTIDGCSLSGQFTIPDPQFNQAYVEATVSGCADAGELIGAAAIIGNGLIVAGSDGFYGRIYGLQ